MTDRYGWREENELDGGGLMRDGCWLAWVHALTYLPYVQRRSADGPIGPLGANVPPLRCRA